MRKFEKISFKQFKKDFGDDRMLYDSYELPKRSTKKSAGYDIKSLEDGVIKPGEAMTFKTGLKVCMNDDECLYILSRSSQGYKYNVCLMNSVGLIDSDFYNNSSNEGHFSVRLVNFGTEDYVVKVGDKIAQAVFSKYLTVDDEEEIEGERTGGLGSTGK